MYIYKDKTHLKKKYLQKKDIYEKKPGYKEKI